MIKENQKILNFINIMIDALIIAFTYMLAYRMRATSDLILYVQSVTFSQYMQYVVIVVPLYLFSYYLFKVYTAQRLKSLVEEISKIVKANIVATIAFFTVLFILKDVNYSRYMTLIFIFWNMLLTAISRIVLRYMLRRIRRKGFNIKRAVLIGNSDTAMDFLQKTQQNLQWGYKIVAIFEEKVNINRQKRLKEKYKLSYIPRYDYNMIEAYLADKRVDEVVIGIKLKEYEHLDKIIRVCES